MNKWVRAIVDGWSDRKALPSLQQQTTITKLSVLIACVSNHHPIRVFVLVNQLHPLIVLNGGGFLAANLLFLSHGENGTETKFSLQQYKV